MESLWTDIEEKCEGKTISTISANDFGIIVRFTDGTKLTHINGVMELQE